MKKLLIWFIPFLMILGGCGMKTINVTKPDGTQISGSAASLFQDTDIGRLDVENGTFKAKLEGYKSANKAELIQLLNKLAP